MKFAKIKDVKSPNRANSTDAGIDLFVPECQEPITLKPQESCIIPSGIKFNVPEGQALIAFNKSGIAVNKKLHVGACVIDCGYQGEVHINLTNVGLIDQHINPGDKIVQVVLLELGNPSVEEVNDEDLFESESSRGTGKFGSTGEK